MTKLELSFQQFLINLATCNGSTSLLTESFDVSINVELSAPLANAVRKMSCDFNGPIDTA